MSLEIFRNSRLQANILVILLQKHGNKDDPVLSFATKYLCRVTYHLNVEAIFLQLGEAHAAS